MMQLKVFFVLVVLKALFHLNVANINASCANDGTVLWDSLNIFNGVHLYNQWKISYVENLSQICEKEIEELVESANNGSAWAVKMLDANGKYSGNIFEGNEYWLGSKTSCQKLESFRKKINSTDYNIINYNQTYRRTFENRIVVDNNGLDIFSVPPYPIEFSLATFLLKMDFFCQFPNYTESKINVGLCLPSSCQAEDIRNALEWVTNKSVFKIANVQVLRSEYSVWNDSRFYILSILFFTTSILITLGTIVDFINFKDDSKHKTTKWYQILNAFNVIKNIKFICSLDVGDDTLSPIHGLKFISMMWVILVHSCLILFQVAENKKFRDDVENNFIFQTISNAAYSVDTFFTLSGLLVSFLFFRTIGKYSVEKLIGQSGFIAHIYLYISMLVYRLLRLSFPYIVVIILTGFITQQKKETSAIQLPNIDNINCELYWWRNVFYVNTFFPSYQMCMNWSWYLSNDTQFYVLGVPILLIALYSRVIAASLALSCLVLSWLTTAIISYETQHITDVRDPFANYDQLYDKPWTRFGPYLIGMITGWLLFRIDCTLKITRTLNYVLWFCAGSALIFTVYGPVHFNSNLTFGVFYSSMSHSIWSLAISWIVIACVTNNGFFVNNILSYRYMYPLSRLSYCAYLIHPLIIRMVLTSPEKPMFISVEIVVVLFFGFLFLSLFFAAILSLAFESPIVALLRLGHPRRNNN